jgi:hypothetical protein
MKIQQYIGLAMGWAIIQLIILSAVWLLWNLIVPGITNWSHAEFFQIVCVYALYKLFTFDWIKIFNDNNLGSKIEKNEE